MDFFENRYYKLNKTTLAFLGLWPYKGEWNCRIRRTFTVTIIMSIIVGEIIFLSEVWGDWDVFIDALVPVGVQVAALAKGINAMFNASKMRQLLDLMKTNWSGIDRIDEVEIMRKYSEQGRGITLFYTIWMAVSAFIWSCVPLYPRALDHIIPLENGTRPKLYFVQTQFYYDREEYFLQLLAHSYAAFILVMFNIVAADAMYAVYVEHACALFSIVGYRLENLGKDSSGDIDVNQSKDTDRNYDELVICIAKHFQAIEFAKLIESAYSLGWLFQVGLSLLMLSFTGIQLLIKMGEYDQMIRLAQFILAQLCHLFFNSWPGQKLLDCTTDFRYSIYAAEWYSLSLRARKLLKIIMIRALTPQKITAGKLYDMSMENFGSVVQTSVSYFTVFASFR